MWSRYQKTPLVILCLRRYLQIKRLDLYSNLFCYLLVTLLSMAALLTAWATNSWITLLNGKGIT